MRRKCNIGLDQPLEFQERLIVEYHVVEFVEPGTGLLQAIGNRMLRERCVVPAAGKAFLLSGRHNASVFHQRGGAVMIECRDTENPHG